ncbi:hypothetical protein KKD19_05630 [Patescibacteria group bacterium]|nr:hypothetical protein [Patescibacteria group bacterium]MBU4512686.1 hypothetical protein [Patescibacteria group bacterium]MCG2693588.1 hypothetical protein [Candidatus Parcubacteria bacterium]
MREEIKQARVTIPLGAMRCISGYPKERKVICEINMDALEKVNDAETFDEIISQARLNYALGNYETFNSARELVEDLHKYI